MKQSVMKNLSNKSLADFTDDVDFYASPSVKICAICGEQNLQDLLNLRDVKKSGVKLKMRFLQNDKVCG